MITLNKVPFVYREKITLPELVAVYNETSPKKVAFDGFVVIINDVPVTPTKAQTTVLSDHDAILMLPFLDGG